MKGRMLGQISCWLKGQQTEQIIHIWAGIWPVLTPCKDTMFAQFISNTDTTVIISEIVRNVFYKVWLGNMLETF